MNQPANNGTCICRDCGTFVPPYRAVEGTFDASDGTVVCQTCG